MNTIVQIARIIRAAVLGVLTDTKVPPPAPVRVKLATRNGYGGNDPDLPRS